MIFLSKINLQRCVFYFLLLLILILKLNFLIAYEIVFYVLFEIINQNKKYNQFQYHKFYNWLFILFLLYIIFVRASFFKFSKAIDFHINTSEHIFFSMIICFILLLFFKIYFSPKNNNFLNIIFVFIGFNFIGILNEFFQNWYQNSEIFNLKPDDIKDIKINLTGSGLFLVLHFISNLNQINSLKTKKFNK